MARKKTKDVAPDAFQQEGEAWVKWLEEHIKLVIGGIVLVLAVVIGLRQLQSHNQRSNALVTSELNTAVEAYREATGLQKVLTSTSAEMLNRDFAKAAKKLSGFAGQYPGTDAARIATAYEADLLARMDKHAEAETKFKSYVDSAKPGDPLLFFALEGLGYAQEAQEKLDEAVATFDQLVQQRPFMKAMALKHKGRILEKKGDAAGAKVAYQAILDELKAQIEKKYGPTPPPNIPERTLERYAESRLKSL